MHTISPDPEKLKQALESWDWLGVSGKNPIVVTAFADVFLEDSNGIWLLDTLEGKLKFFCRTRDEMDPLLSTEKSQNIYFFADLIGQAVSEGLCLSAGECYDFKLPPALGGEIAYPNVEKTNFVLALNLRGQIHARNRQIEE